MKDQQVVKALPAHAPEKALARGIGSWGVVRRFQDLDAACCCEMRKAAPELCIIIANEISGCLPIGVASRSCCATQVSVGARVTPTWITFLDFSSITKKTNTERKKRSVTCKKSQDQTSLAWL